MFLQEAPWILGIIAGCVLLWVRGRAFLPDGPPIGFGWWDYLMLAWHRLHPLPGEGGSWRNPLWLAWVAGWGGSIGYADAAVYISSISLYLLVAATGLTGRLLASPWAGGLAALSIPFVRTNAEAVRWMTHYPALAAASALVILAGVAVARLPRWPMALATGVALGGAWALDWRGLTLLLPAGALLLLAMTTAGLGWRRWLLPVAMGAGLLVGPLGIRGLGGRDLLPVESQVTEQRQVIRRWMATTHDPALARDCLSGPDLPASDPAYWATACPGTLLRYNLAHDYRRELPFDVGPTLLALGLVLLPGRRRTPGPAAGTLRETGLASRLRPSLESASALALPWAGLLASATWVLLPDRYVLQLASITALLVPVAIFRVAATVLPHRLAPWVEAGSILAAGAWLVWGGPPYRGQATLMEANQDLHMAWEMRASLEPRLGPEDRLLDCSVSHLEPLLLPRQLHEPPPMLKAVDEERCRAWIRAPETGPGTTWLVTDGRLTPEWEGVAGWTREASAEGFSKEAILWRWEG